MILIEFSKKPRLYFAKGREFNDPTRFNIYIMFFLFINIVIINKKSDLTNVFNRSYTTDDLSWVEAIKIEKKKLDQHYDKYWYEYYLKDLKRIGDLVEEKDKQLRKYKEATTDFKNLAYAVRRINNIDFDKIENLDK